jgi:hypothetical protein
MVNSTPVKWGFSFWVGYSHTGKAFSVERTADRMKLGRLEDWNFYFELFFYIIVKLFKEFIMEIIANINLRIDDLAKVIANLSKEELKILEIRLSKEDNILKKRLTDVKNKKVKLLSRKQVFSNL